MQRASLSNDDIVSMVETLYGLHVSRLTKLNSYDDVNIHVHVRNASDNNHIPDVSEDGYVLKILNSLDSKKVKFMDAMHAAIFQCHSAGIRTPRPLPNRQGEYFSLEELPTSKEQPGNVAEKQMFIVRLFEYMPGELMSGKPCTAQLCYSVGQTAGKVDKALMGFYHPGYEGHARHWCLSNTDFVDKVDAVDNENDRELVRDVVRAFKSNVMGNCHKLQKGVIHGDINDQNLLVKPMTERSLPEISINCDQTEPREIYTVQGVLDFGDSVYRYYLFEIAITIMYMMEHNDRLDPVDVGGITLAGYLSELELPTFDLSFLKECVCERFAQSLVVGTYEYKMNPSNKYVLRTAAKGWPLFRKFQKIPKHELYAKWQSVLKNFKINIELNGCV